MSLNSYTYGIVKKKRDEVWKTHYEKMTRDEKDEVWSIIYARWGKSYEAGKSLGIGRAWQSYFKWMFQIIAFEVVGYKDLISSTEWIITKWSRDMEMPEVYGNVELYRKLIWQK